MDSEIDRPLEFIRMDEEGKFHMNQDTLRCLSEIKQSVVVVSIIGKYRSGKSYLMNTLAGKRTGFMLGHAVQSCTKGIWVWPRPHPHYPKRMLLLLDTEGLGDVEKDSESHDIHLFTLTLLLSSVLIYNTSNVLCSNGFDQLHMVLNLADHVNTKIHQREDERGMDFHQYFPTFVVCLRDFTLVLEIDGNPCTADEYLEHCLNIRKKGKSRSCRDFNDQRECMCQYFQDRKCFAFPMPTSQDEELGHLDTLSDEKLDKQFLKMVEDFRTMIYVKGKVKSSGNVVLNGDCFATMATQYVEAITKGAIPCIESTTQVAVKQANMKAKQDSVNLYKTSMAGVEQQLPMSVKDLMEHQKKSVNDALKLFMNNCVLDRDHEHEKDLQQYFVDQEKFWVEQNYLRSKKESERCLQSLYDPIQQDVEAGQFHCPGGYAKYRERIDEVILKYNNTPKLGPWQHEEMKHFLEKISSESRKISRLDTLLQETERKKFALQEEERLEEQTQNAFQTQSDQNGIMMEAMKSQFETSNTLFEMKIKTMEQQLQAKLERENEERSSIFTPILDVACAALSVFSPVKGLIARTARGFIKSLFKI
uniref:guanylate-binding protein 2-like n=1 Tax=Myxine glutinosa TaxID=7769 RepID=UPI0035900D04